jgi:F-type H+-transporting ATPase subunit delta
MKISNKQYAQGLFAAIDGQTGVAMTEALANFVRLLAANGAISRSKAIIFEFEKLWQIAKSAVYGQLVSARRLSDESLFMIETYVKEATGVKNVHLENKLDKNLLAGFVLSYGDYIIDGSAKGMIGKLRTELTK